MCLCNNGGGCCHTHHLICLISSFTNSVPPASHLSYDGDKVLTEQAEPLPGPACSYKQLGVVGRKAECTAGGSKLVLTGRKGHNGDSI